MTVENEYLEGLDDIADILDELDDDELWERYDFTANALARHFDMELEMVFIDG